VRETNRLLKEIAEMLREAKAKLSNFPL